MLSLHCGFICDICPRELNGYHVVLAVRFTVRGTTGVIELVPSRLLPSDPVIIDHDWDFNSALSHACSPVLQRLL